MHTPISELRAILFAVTGFTCWVLGDSVIKWVGRFGLPPVEIVAAMGLFMALTLFTQALVRGRVRQLRPRSLPRQILRSLLDMSNNVCVVIALHHLSLTMFYILVFTSPLAITLLSAATLGERITRQKSIALLLGFSGVIVAVAPWHGQQRVDLIGLLCCMVCVACFSVNMVWSRVLTRTETPESLAIFSGIVTAIAGGAVSCLHPHAVQTAALGWLLFMGLCCAGGTLCFYVAVQHTTASTVSLYHYTQLVTGAFIAYLVWHELPSAPMLAGALLIVAAGAWIALTAERSVTESGTAG